MEEKEFARKEDQFDQNFGESNFENTNGNSQ
jgi:hypothetical protein